MFCIYLRLLKAALEIAHDFLIFLLKILPVLVIFKRDFYFCIFEEKYFGIKL